MGGSIYVKSEESFTFIEGYNEYVNPIVPIEPWYLNHLYIGMYIDQWNVLIQQNSVGWFTSGNGDEIIDYLTLCVCTDMKYDDTEYDDTVLIKNKIREIFANRSYEIQGWLFIPC